ncbi:PaREP1 family protein [Vulcanisaeta sp. JCM 16161]|uniref:PaREP1 family protein n=1 Tax=Vulcanisaeta sp. JCM 16161 TaxID=1295372 RepID=UPI0006D26F71|nr:PaREP1 family protein [Vulcanisaeta sp. JCM 16161]
MLLPVIYDLIRELANGKDVNAFIADLLAARLDPSRRVGFYFKLHEDFLREAEDLYSKGDLVQAGEKYWGAVTALLNAIAESRGWEHYSHRDYDVIIERLANELHDDELRTLFDSAEKPHANFYHNFLIRRGRVLTLIRRLNEYLTKVRQA